MCSMPRAESTQASAGPPEPEPERPTWRDEVAASGSELIGGPLGRHAQVGASWWSPVRVIVLVAIGVFGLGMAQKAPCYDGGWFRGAGSQYTHACYSDIPHLYQGRGFADGLVPYVDRLPGDMAFLEYPVLTGAFMEFASWLTPGDGTIQYREQWYWMVNAALLMVCALVIVVCVTRVHARRPWDGLLVALAPAAALTATINWDLLAGALTAAALLMWSRSRPLAFGVLLGLATAAKLYPLLILGPLLVLCWRAGRMRAFGMAMGGAVAAWLAVNLPVMIFAFEGWSTFYVFSRERGVDYGSFWLILAQNSAAPPATETVNTLATFLMLLCCGGIAALTLMGPRRPRFAQVAFLIVAAFVLTNKVYSPQYVLWLVPLAVLARPKWRDFLIWQACEVAYFLGIWMYLAYTTSGEAHQGLPPEGYHWAIAAHLLGTLFLALMVVRDILLPERDPVRTAGVDDPSGGVLDGAPDVFTLRRAEERGTRVAASGPPVEWTVEPAEGDRSSRATAPLPEEPPGGSSGRA
ncbi:glycosyltransferase 87 family protein [Streptomyces sp. HSG2]|uniref:glycosyltransferase family 87 protein n=1 Tax=Streptomyces sp. HSG2 TaxID=2797167 RepID=UPI001905EE15|nr:glycosyltransferase 87 family protein [Streptomyces sp. HSG2]